MTGRRWRAAAIGAVAALAVPAWGEPRATTPTGVCPYTSEDIQAALGVGMKWMAPLEDKSDGVRTTTCRGIVQGADGYLTVVRTHWPRDTASKRFSAFLRTEMKDAEAVPGDPDGAHWSARTDLRTYGIAYLRGAVLTRILVASPDKDVVPRLRDGLLKLKRLP
jgi:hypothetical protein